LNKKTILFSSAHHKLIVIRCNGEEEVYNGSKHHIGAAFHADFTFEEHFVQLQTGDQVYMLTDGVYDQKGGIEGKKLYLQRVRELFGNVSDFPMEEQKKLIATYLEEWKENREQLDDMLVFSIKF
jgi:serine phosphatase RsbU (regulator of sigma subunit)